MIHKLAALLVATLIAITSVPAFTYAQNATSTTNTTTTETNTTIPVENNTATQLPVFPESPLMELGNQTTASNQTEQGIVSKDNATKVIGLLRRCTNQNRRSKRFDKRTSSTNRSR